MTQREIERSTGYVALACWFFFVLALASLAGFVSSHPESTTRRAAERAAAPLHGGKHPSKAVVAAAVDNAVADRNHDEALAIATVMDILLVVSIAATCWWRWRRKQRVRAEIRAEAWGRQSLSSGGRDRRAGSVQLF